MQKVLPENRFYDRDSHTSLAPVSNEYVVRGYVPPLDHVQKPCCAGELDI